MTDTLETAATAARGFADRHIGPREDDEAVMLAAVGASDVEELMARAVPDAIRTTPGEGLGVLPPAAGEREALEELTRLAAGNTVRRSMIGLGYHGTTTPAVIRRMVLEDPRWYTAYTPYQPEISQGRLEALIDFQTMVAELTGLDTANASMLDEATAVAEAMLLARRVAKRRPARLLVDRDVLPQTRAVLATRAEAVGIELVDVDVVAGEAPDAGEHLGLVVQHPGASGRVSDPSAAIAATREQGGVAIVACDLLAATLLTPPGELGADIAVGTSQRFGVPLGFGGPHAGYLAVRSGLERQLPGRLVGVSQDAAGRPAYRLTLQTREQHIRREKATSNICTAQVLLAVMAAFYAVYHGPEGLTSIARRVHADAVRLAHALAPVASLEHEAFFDTLRLRVPGRADAVVEAALAEGIALWRADPDTVQVAVDETTTDADLAAVARAFGAGDVPAADAVPDALPAALARTSAFLTHPTFSAYRSETAMLRHLSALAEKDYALDRGMIPLGSCTMKLNAATEMASITWPAFADVHPFQRAEDVSGYRAVTSDLERWLAALTGYDTVSLQPNAGSQGELAGLLAIRGWHRSRGETQRDVCLIPQSAHGTNAASAVLAGMRVVVVATDERGDVDLADLERRIDENRDALAALMITYPSTHGVYERRVRDVCAAVHEAGGQVYIDGANLNAVLGHARFGEIGGDVSHLNLHKTFCIPHGGGGPGVGPVAAKSHLAPFLPSHPLAQWSDHGGHDHAGGAVSAAPYGSPGILPISWAYVRMMGAEGLTRATGAAVLAANYLAVKLGEAFPVLYAGEDGLVAHECILDIRPLTQRTGVTVDDVAKRLIDYGFHAPTMSFPVPGTLMVEPTESEDLAELDRFVAAMLAIRAEADAVADGRWPADDNPLVNAPHTAESIAVDEWTHPYPREQAVYPVPSLRRRKYWSPVARVDQAWGDRNLFCACPPPEAFA